LSAAPVPPHPKAGSAQATCPATWTGGTSTGGQPLQWPFALATGRHAPSADTVERPIDCKVEHMKTIGLLGGMSWESTVPYYRQINETVKARLGGLHSAQLILYSVDFHEIEQLQHAGDWEKAGTALAEAARALERAGADFLVLCTNTMHKVAPRIESAVGIALLHIADPTAAAVQAAGHSTVGLLGTRFTMEQPFYRDRLVERHGLQVIVPDAEDRACVHRIIYEELCLGVVRPQSRQAFQQVLARLTARGAQAVIMGCTEISLLIGPQDAEVPLFDTTAIHARAAAEQALAGRSASPFAG
jgi:aspartate racemase